MKYEIWETAGPWVPIFRFANQNKFKRKVSVVFADVIIVLFKGWFKVPNLNRNSLLCTVTGIIWDILDLLNENCEINYAVSIHLNDRLVLKVSGII